MPSLAKMLQTQSLPGFEATDNKMPTSPPPASVEGSQVGLNPYLRCPLPPFSTTIDTIRQWNMTGKNPVMRVIPLPVQQGAGGSAVNVTNVSTTASSSGGGTAPVVPPTPLTPATVVFNVPFLAPGATYQTSVKMSRSFQQLQLQATQPVEVRMYSNPVTQVIDIARVTDIAVPFDTIEGVLTDIVFDQYPFQWEWENRIGANADNPQTTNVYFTVVNPSQTTGVNPSVVTVIYQPLES